MKNNNENQNLTPITYSTAHQINNDIGKILVIEDHLFSRMTTVDLLTAEGYQVYEQEGNNNNIFAEILKIEPDLILLNLVDYNSERLNLCQQIKEDYKTYLIPVIFTSVSEENNLRLKCFEVGGDDLLIKPLERILLKTRVKSLIKQKKLNENLDQTEQVLFSIAKAIESKYNFHAKNTLTLVDLAEKFGKYINLTNAEINNLICAAYLHDIGTVFIPDAILLKEDPLSKKEKELLKQHVLLGEKICQPLKNKQGVVAIIRHHHERRDGTGYPDGLKDDNIPWLAQIFQILDIYHALTSERPHKRAFNTQEALEILREETNKGWRNEYIVEQFNLFISNNHKSCQLMAS